MSEKVDYQVGFEYTSEGVAGVSADIDKLIDRVDQLARANEIGDRQQDKSTDGLLRAQTALTGASREIRDYSEAWATLRKEISNTSNTLSGLAKDNVLAGGRTPKVEVSSLMSEEEARKVLAFYEAEEVSARQTAKIVVQEADAKAKSEKQAAQETAAMWESVRKREVSAAEDAAKESNRQMEARVKEQQRIRSAVDSERSGRGYSNASTTIDAEIAAQQKAAKQFSTSLKSRLEGEAAIERQVKASAAVEQKAANETAAMWEAVRKRQVASAKEEAQESNRQMEARVQAQQSLIKAQGPADAHVKAWEAQKKATQDATVAVQEHEQSIISLRYASYDMGQTFLRASAVIVGAGVGITAAFASQERAFADVIRTSESGVGELQDAFRELSTTIPVSFNDLSQIATLGNQLGVAGQDIEAFTETIAQFSAATGISFEASAEAFGKLGNLLGVSADEYDRLGSSIAYVGRTTAASEAQIIAISKELAPAAASAGFTAAEVVGLSGALGSLGVPPERSRSTILQFFETLNTATAEGGEKLESFARVVGVTASELDQMVRSGQGEDILSRFINTAAYNDTVAITQALNDLGLAGLRTNPTIRALAGSNDLLVQSIRNGRSSWDENLELQRQMEVINGTLSASWQRFLNAAMNAAASLGAEVAPALKDVLDVAVSLLQGFAEFVESPFGGWLVRLGATLALAATSFMTVRGAIALATGSALAFKFALQQGIGLGMVNGLRGLAGAIGLVGGASDASAFSVQKLGLALKFLGRAVVIGAVFQYIAEWLFNTAGAAQETGNVLIWLADAAIDVGNYLGQLFGMGGLLGTAAGMATQPMRDVGNSLKNWGKSLEKANSGIGQASAGMLDFGQYVDDAFGSMEDLGGATDDLGGSVDEAVKEVRTLLDYSSDLAQVWNRAFDIRFSGQETLDNVTSQFIKIREENERAAKAIRDLRNDIRGLNSDISIQEYYLSIAVEYGDTQRAQAIEAELAKKRAELADKTAELQKEEEKSKKSLTGNTSASIEHRKTITDLVKGYQSHIEALAASGMSEQQLLQETARLKQEFISQATQLGYNQVEVLKYAAAFDDVSTAIRAIPRNITVTANTNPAQQALNEMKAAADKANSSLNTLRGNAGKQISMPGLANNNNAKELRRMALEAEMVTHSRNANMLSAAGGAANMQGARLSAYEAARIRALLASGNYWSGGYTGAGGMYEPAGVVHRGEYVIPKRDVNQATGLPYADALGKLVHGTPSPNSYARGGYVNPTTQAGIVDLSPRSIHAIAQAVPQYIVMDAKIVGETTSQQYARTTSVGRN